MDDSTPSMGDVDLTDLICTLLGRFPGWQYDPDPDAPAYPESVVGIYYGAIQPSPDRAVGVRVYADIDDDLSVRRAQLLLRGGKHNAAGADALADLAFLMLHQLSRVGGISDVRRISGGPLGADDSGREERSENYQIILDNPEVLA